METVNGKDKVLVMLAAAEHKQPCSNDSSVHMHRCFP